MRHKVQGFIEDDVYHYLRNYCKQNHITSQLVFELLVEQFIAGNITLPALPTPQGDNQ